MTVSLQHELIVLPEKLRGAIDEELRASGIEVEDYDDPKLRSRRHQGDFLLLCKRNDAAVELWGVGKDEVPQSLGNLMGVTFWDHGGFLRQLLHRRADLQLQRDIAGILYRLKTSAEN
ncbi:MAG TPA: hypothetical protein VNL17_03970 [Verrucomicrobiae bacterium]|nr:hypothetical protein [Verrucomicrobiae bacterium]